MTILALNCGSSSLKFGIYSDENLLFEGEAEEIGKDKSQYWTRLADAPKQQSKQSITDHKAALGIALRSIKDAGISEIAAVGHRIVHGGPKLRDHVQLDAKVLDELRSAVPFAPLHLPSSLAVIDAVSMAMEGLPQVVCLDTSFHKDLPDVAKTLPFPDNVREFGIERYGFHGLSLESIVEQLNPVPERLVVAHLGNGSSITAIAAGKSIDTTMGLTPTGGVMMGTRTGDVDPGVLIYLLRHAYGADELEAMVDHESGLKGISSRTSDVRELIEARKQDRQCDLALRMFAYQVKKSIAGMAAALGGLDLLVFTGGIGEHAEAVRQEIQVGLNCLDSFEIKVLPAQEDLQIARITERVLTARQRQ